MKIIVVGDSWGWQPCDSDAKNYPGFADLLAEQGYDVANIARPNQSNKTSIEALEKFFQTENHTDKLVFFVQSDPFRSIRPYAGFTQLIIEHQGLRNARKHVMQQDYDRLITIANQFQAPVYLIGGLSNADQDLLANDKWCQVLIDSWVRFLVGARPENQHIDWSNWGIWGADWTLNNISINALMNTGAMHGTLGSLAEQVIEELAVWDQNNRVFTPDFFPDGQHPNRAGHRILFDYIMATVLSQEK